MAKTHIYTEAEIDQILEFKKKGVSGPEIIKIMGLTAKPASLSKMLARRGLTNDKRKSKEKTDYQKRKDRSFLPIERRDSIRSNLSYEYFELGIDSIATKLANVICHDNS